MAAQQPPQAAVEDPALLLAVLRRDLPALFAVLGRPNPPLTFRGVTALHAAALANFPEAVKPLLRAQGSLLESSLGSAITATNVQATLLALAPLHLSASQLGALLFSSPTKSPLAVAVSNGAFATAQQLGAAGASRIAGFTALTSLAAQLAAAAGGHTTEAAAVQVPAAVQEMAAVLLAGQLPPVEARSVLRTVCALHVVAVQLAHPRRLTPASRGTEDPYPPCAWLLQHLLQLHSRGWLSTTQDCSGTAIAYVLQKLQERMDQVPDEEMAQWLTVPAAARVTQFNLRTLAVQLCSKGKLAGMVAALALPALQQTLQQEAVAGADGHGWGSVVPLVVMAAQAGPAALDAVLSAGGSVSLGALHAVIHGKPAGQDSVKALALLLSRGKPAVPSHGLVHAVETCPIYALLNVLPVRLLEALHEGSIFHPGGYEHTFEPMERQHLVHLGMMEALVAAGYRPTTFTSYKHSITAPLLSSHYPPDDPNLAHIWELDTGGRWLWLAAQQLPWTWERHPLFPPAFRAAARTLLLVAHRGATTAARGLDAVPTGTVTRSRRRAAAGSSGSSLEGARWLGALPPNVIQRIIELCAYPLSAWRPLPDGGSAWGTLQDMKENPEDYLEDSEPDYAYDYPYDYL